MQTDAWIVARAGDQPTKTRITLDELRADEVLVEMIATGVCGTDIHCAAGHFPTQIEDTVLGHEGGGKVVKVGSAVKRVKVGDKVILSFPFCEKCRQCKMGKPSWCDHSNEMLFGARREIGKTADGRTVHGSFFGQSSFSRHSICHETSCNVVPPDTDMQSFAAIGCGIMTGAGAVMNVLKADSGSAAVYGCGGVGLAALMAAKAIGLSPLIAVDMDAARLQLAKELGATHTIQAGDGDAVAKAIAEATNNVGVEWSVDTTGNTSVLKGAFASCARLGSIAIVGTPGPGHEWPIDTFHSIMKGVKINAVCMGGCQPSQFLPELIALNRAGKFPVERLVTTFSELGAAVDAFKAGGSVIKPVVVF